MTARIRYVSFERVPLLGWRTRVQCVDYRITNQQWFIVRRDPCRSIALVSRDARLARFLCVFFDGYDAGGLWSV